MSSLIAFGVALSAVAFGARYALKKMPNMVENASKVYKSFNAKTLSNSRYYKGGFEEKMTKREARLILAVTPASKPARIKKNYYKIIQANHPDANGSKYISEKILAAYEILSK